MCSLCMLVSSSPTMDIDIVNEELSRVTSIMVLSDDFHETLKSLILHVFRQLTAFFLAEYLV